MRYGWLGAYQRSAETPTGNLLMGVRTYSQSLGRFGRTDPVLHGGSHACEYAGQEPLQRLDLDGRFWFSRGKFLYLHLNPTDQRALLQGYVWAFGAAIGFALGGGFGAAAGAFLAGAVGSCISDKFQPRRNLVVKIRWPWRKWPWQGWIGVLH